MVLLWLVPRRGQPFPVKGGRTLVGRHPVKCDLVLDHDTVSKEHLLIEHSGGQWVVTDQQSSNGTFVDGARITSGKLTEGSILRIGQLEFKIRIVTGAPEPRLAPGRQRPPAAPVKPAAAAPALRKKATMPMERTAPANVRKPAPPERPAPASSRNPLPAERPPAAATGPRGAAAELLGVKAGARPQEIQTRYHKLYNDYQIRLTNAPTPQLKRLYQKSLQELRAAYEILCPTNAG